MDIILMKLQNKNRKIHWYLNSFCYSKQIIVPGKNYRFIVTQTGLFVVLSSLLNKEWNNELYWNYDTKYIIILRLSTISSNWQMPIINWTNR